MEKKEKKGDLMSMMPFRKKIICNKSSLHLYIERNCNIANTLI